MILIIEKGGEKGKKLRSCPGSNRGYWKVLKNFKIQSDNHYTTQPCNFRWGKIWSI